MSSPLDWIEQKSRKQIEHRILKVEDFVEWLAGSVGCVRHVFRVAADTSTQMLRRELSLGKVHREVPGARCCVWWASVMDFSRLPLTLRCFSLVKVFNGRLSVLTVGRDGRLVS